MVDDENTKGHFQWDYLLVALRQIHLTDHLITEWINYKKNNNNNNGVDNCLFLKLHASISFPYFRGRMSSLSSPIRTRNVQNTFFVSITFTNLILYEWFQKEKEN